MNAGESRRVSQGRAAAQFARVLLSLCLALASFVSSSCGYALAGRGNALPAEITIIGVPYFTNASSEPEIERVIGDEVRAEFQSKGKYRVQPDDSGVDGLLTGTVTSVELRPTAYTPERLPSAYAIIVTASVIEPVRAPLSSGRLRTGVAARGATTRGTSSTVRVSKSGMRSVSMIMRFPSSGWCSGWDGR